MNILFINPPQIFSNYQTAAGVIPPLGLMYLASIAKENGYNVRILDSVVENPENIHNYRDISYRGLSLESIVDLISKNTDLIGISNLFTFAYPLVKELSKK